MTDDDLDVISGQKDQLVGRIQERYGVHKDEARRQVDDWNRMLDEENESAGERSRQRKAS